MEIMRIKLINTPDKNLKATEQILVNRGIKLADAHHYLNTTDADINDPLEFGHNYLPEFIESPDGQFNIKYVVFNLYRVFIRPLKLKVVRISFGTVLGTSSITVLILFNLIFTLSGICFLI